MHRITLLCIGKVREAWIAEGIAQYVQRLAPRCTLTFNELPASKQKDPARQAAEESESILDAIDGAKGECRLLDEHGRSMTSVAFATFLGQQRDRGTVLTFVIGGAYGVTDEVRARIPHALRLSDMTLTHEMSRLLFLEQLYRAHEILRESGYHH